MLVTEDRILAEVRRIADIVARSLGVAGALLIVEEDLDEAHRAIFGLSRQLGARLDARSLAALVRSDQIPAARELLDTEATLLEAEGDHAGAAHRRAQRDAITG